MTSRSNCMRSAVLGALVLGLLLTTAWADDTPAAKKPATDKPAAQKPADKPATSQPAADAKPATSQPAAHGDLVPIEIPLPKPAFKGTPAHVPPGTNLEAPRKGPRPPVMAPPGVKNVALHAKVTSSDMEPIIGQIKCLTDGDKEASEGAYVELGPMKQWMQVDLGAPQKIYAVVLWHYHANARIYHDVVVQIADDADFITNVRTLFNNDHDNSSGLGLGEQKEYWETFEGKLIEAQGAVARYVRCYSRGNTADDQNHYVELEVYGLPAK